MKKAILTILSAATLVVLISSCENDNTESETYEEINAIDNEEVRDEDI